MARHMTDHGFVSRRARGSPLQACWQRIVAQTVDSRVSALIQVEVAQPILHGEL